ncbi:unnamed protein product [Caenorhabditis auriculariae]|uniref:EGF-like domain-containing protein n=1 Tax=Caenorhabditis auriculariae TaxID=2777116 RepID=A0A8S1HM00_9PELO|nr:unnamed protein product [Caenorhabditis auriculariae]
MQLSAPSASKLEDLPGYARPARHMKLFYSSLLPRLKFRHLIFAFLLWSAVVPAESCLPSWFRQERSSEPEALNRAKELETNIISDDGSSKEDHEIEPGPGPNTLPAHEAPKSEEYEYYDEVETNTIKYNAGAFATSTLTPVLRKEIEKLKDEKCREYCHHNATCHVEVIFHENEVSTVVPSCHCPHGWEGLQCDRPFVQAFYAPVSGNYKAQSSPLPALAVLFVMLAMFVTLVIYAYKRMSNASEDSLYGSSTGTCPPDAFNVLKTPSVRPMYIGSAQKNSVSGPPSRANAHFFSRLGLSRSAESNSASRQYSKMPRVEISAINRSDHIDFSTLSCDIESHCSRPSLTSGPPPVVIEMARVEAEVRVHSRSSGAPPSPTRSTVAPIITES